MADLKTVKQDCEDLKRSLFKFQFQESDIVDLTNLSQSEIAKRLTTDVMKKLNAGKKSDPVVNYLVICLFASHGYLFDGLQQILANEYDHKKEYYKMFPVEMKLRNWATTYPNAYVIGIFACCRQLFNSSKMTGMISKEQKEKLTSDPDAYQHYLKTFEDACKK